MSNFGPKVGDITETWSLKRKSFGKIYKDALLHDFKNIRKRIS